MAISWGSVFRVSLLLVLVAGIATACFTLPVEKILKDFLVWIDKNLGPWGPLVLALVYIPLTVLAVPASILTIGGGYLFGLPIGFIADSIGSTIGCTAAFIVGKTIGRSYVASKLNDYPQFQAVSIATRRSGFKIVFLLRLVPLLPFNVLNYLLSVTSIGLGQYMLASWLGMMPITFALVYIGTTIKDLSDVTHRWSEISKVHWILMTAGLLASAVLIFLVAKIAKRSLAMALEEDGKLNGISVPADSAIAIEACSDVQQPLLVKIDSSACSDVQQPLLVKIDGSVDRHDN